MFHEVLKNLRFVSRLVKSNKYENADKNKSDWESSKKTISTLSEQKQNQDSNYPKTYIDVDVPWNPISSDTWYVYYKPF